MVGGASRFGPLYLERRRERLLPFVEEVEPAQPPDHPGASSGSIVQSSGKAAFSASAIVCCTLVSAISKV